MEISSIKFRYFEKLKLWHDYLSKGSIFETQKKEYWDHEKLFLFWAYTPLHRHLYTSVGTKRMLEIYDIGRDQNDNSKEFGDLKAYFCNGYSGELDSLRSEIEKDTGKINYVKGNLSVEEFVDPISDEKGYPEKIRILPKGLLLGEILFEALSKNAKWYQKNFLQYRVGYWLLNGIFFIAALSLFLTLINQSIELFGIKEKDIYVIPNYQYFERHHHQFYR